MVTFEKLCGNCPHTNCCTDSAVPLVFDIDSTRLNEIGKNTNDYLSEKRIDGRWVKYIRKKEGSNSCVFWDEKKGCTIYKHRPMDCRLYPFDILTVNGEYHWIVYSCNPESDWEWSEEYLRMFEEEEGFEEFIKNIHFFEEHTKIIIPTESEKTPYTVLRKVKDKK